MSATSEESRQKRLAYNRAYHRKHREKLNAQRKQWCKDNPKSDWQSQLRKNYDLTISEYWRMFAFQGGRCKICRALPGAKRLHVDHNHTTGKIRGLLCGKCNTGLGFFQDSAGMLCRAMEYLEANNG